MKRDKYLVNFANPLSGNLKLSVDRVICNDFFMYRRIEDDFANLSN